MVSASLSPPWRRRPHPPPLCLLPKNHLLRNNSPFSSCKCLHCPRHLSTSHLHRSRLLLHVHPSHLSRLASYHRRCRPARPRTYSLHTIRLLAPSSCHGCHGYFCCVEACLVHSWERHMGESIVFFFLLLRSCSHFLKNVLAGALFSPALATLFLTLLTTLGSLCATLLSTPLSPFLTHLFPRALDLARAALSGDSELDQNSPCTDSSKPKKSAWVRLSVLRLVGVVPWSAINIACGVCNVSLTDCLLGSFIGCLPWTAVTCQVRPESTTPSFQSN